MSGSLYAHAESCIPTSTECPEQCNTAILQYCPFLHVFFCDDDFRLLVLACDMNHSQRYTAGEGAEKAAGDNLGENFENPAREGDEAGHCQAGGGNGVALYRVPQGRQKNVRATSIVIHVL